MLIPRATDCGPCRSQRYVFVTSHSIFFFYHYNFLWPNDVTTLVLFKNTNVLRSRSKSANSPLHFQTWTFCLIEKSHTVSKGGKGMQDIVISTWDWYMLWSCNTWKGKLMVLHSANPNNNEWRKISPADVAVQGSARKWIWKRSWNADRKETAATCFSGKMPACPEQSMRETACYNRMVCVCVLFPVHVQP